LLLIASEHTDVYFNLAAEDYLLHHFKEDILMFWRSRKAAVCGKHQNLCAEINYAYCKQNAIDMARRLSGGGTVFHDPGNINFTFLQTIPEGLEHAVNYQRFLEPIRRALSSMGIETTYSNRNDLLLDGKKISGNAEHVLQREKRVLHHGTLLFHSDLDALGAALHPEGIYTDKAVKSVRSEVTNITNHHKRIPDAETFLQRLFEFFLSEKHTYRYVFNSNDLSVIQNLQNDKYATEKWIVGYSPSYHLQKNIVLGSENLNLELETQNGQITRLDLRTQNGTNPFEIQTKKMERLPFSEQNINEFLRSLPIGSFTPETVYLFF
jgi:lipoate-protein ligase A